MPTIEQLAAMPTQRATLPTTPGSAIRARAAGKAHVDIWVLHDDRSWCDTNGDRRIRPGQLNLTQVLYVAPDLDGVA
jgi:hypothetical protein